MPRSRLTSFARRVTQILLVTLGCLLAAPAVSAAQSPTVLALRIDDTIVKDPPDVPVIADR